LTIHVDRNSQQLLKSQMASARVGDFPLQPEDLNTDGIDAGGQDIWVHDCRILNDDDSIAVKPVDSSFLDCSRNMLFENLVLTGFGASIGSVPPHPGGNCVSNITFRNIEMPGTGRGIYVKSNPSCRNNASALIEDILFENFLITKPRYWGIW
jgi:polygalacturonase